MRFSPTPSSPSNSQNCAMDHPDFARLLSGKTPPPFPKSPGASVNPHEEDFFWPSQSVTSTTLAKIRDRLELDLDDIEECALVLNGLSASNGFLFTPKLFQALGDSPRAVWYGRHTLFIVGEPGFYSLLHWDRCNPHYIAHYDPLQDRLPFTCPPGVQRLVKATFHHGSCPNLPISRMKCPKSSVVDSAFYSVCFAHALLVGQPIPERPVPKVLFDTMRNFHENPAPTTYNVVQMRPSRRSALGPLEWLIPDAKVPSTSSAAPRLQNVSPCTSIKVAQAGDSAQGTTASSTPMPRDFPSRLATSEVIGSPATYKGEQAESILDGSLPVRSAPTSSGAVPGTSPTNGPSAKGKEPATSSTNDLSTKDKRLEAGASNHPSAKGKERQGSWREQWCELVDKCTEIERQGKLLVQLQAEEDQAELEEAFNKFATAENDALVANGKEPRYPPFKEFMLDGVNQPFKLAKVKSELADMMLEVTGAAAKNGLSPDQSPKFHEMLSICADRRGVPEVPSKISKIFKYRKPQTGIVKGKLPFFIHSPSAKEKKCEARVTTAPLGKGKERQGRLYEEVMAEYTEKGFAFAKATSEKKVASAAVFLAKNRLYGLDVDLSELKEWLEFRMLTQEELTKACDRASLFVSGLLRDCILNRNCRAEEAEKDDLMVDIYLKRMKGKPLREELERLEEEFKAKDEAYTEILNQFVNPFMKKGFLDDARSGAFSDQTLSDDYVKYWEGLFGSREFLSYL
ncbi:hypothetical protein NW768_002484 [Fusarium equiseti]|uniref:Uncharacterized protein n=1 Tax=Fusarium equiseti TaxID=61235 RepID=A0ABQ8RNZ1_FUSEQ|nr:hypothetical protein NW768_002484 [Fusarium equiseti]